MRSPSQCIKSSLLLVFFLLSAELFTVSVTAQTQQDISQDRLYDSADEPAPSLSSLDHLSGMLQCDSTEQHSVASSSTPRTVSAAVVVSAARYLQGVANQLEGNTAYSRYMERIAERRSQQYYSDNDGRLYALDSVTGEEQLTFTPAAVFAQQDQQAGHSYPYFVGSAPVVADVYDGAQWRTILVGTLGAAGKGLFALDVTHPDAIQVLWELDDASPTLEQLGVKLGYGFSQPSIARLHTGQWAVVSGNGYQAVGADQGAAALYIIDALDGSMIKSLEVQSDVAAANGLSSPRLADYDGDGVADYAYAGDLHGNLWRFDLLGDGAVSAKLTPPTHASYGALSGSSARFTPSYAGRPMFIARAAGHATRQPITAAPSIVPHPTGKGYLVIVGTGSHVVTADAAEGAYAHSLYGVWDMKTTAEITAAETITDEQLALQSITSATLGIAQESGLQREARVISNNPVEWHTDFDPAKTVKQRGWRLDLPVGEMLIENMRSLGTMLLLQTLVPHADPCVADARYWLYAINPATGGATAHHAFDTRTAETAIVSAIQFGSPSGVDLGQDAQGFVARSSDDQERLTPPPESMGRQSWRMIIEP